MSLLPHASEEKFSQGMYFYIQVYFRNVTVEYARKAVCSLTCSCGSFFLCTRALKTMLIQHYTRLVCKPVIAFAINIVLQNLFAEIM